MRTTIQPKKIEYIEGRSGKMHWRVEDEAGAVYYFHGPVIPGIGMLKGNAYGIEYTENAKGFKKIEEVIGIAETIQPADETLSPVPEKVVNWATLRPQEKARYDENNRNYEATHPKPTSEKEYVFEDSPQQHAMVLTGYVKDLLNDGDEPYLEEPATKTIINIYKNILKELG